LEEKFHLSDDASRAVETLKSTRLASMATEPDQQVSKELTCEVVVIGGGLAGLSASIHLAKREFDVICIEPSTDLSRIVGESLDWSAPELFQELDLNMEDLVQAEISTFKRHVILELKNGAGTEYVPSPWLARPPLNVELRTLHVDRRRLHENLIRLAAGKGVTTLRDRVAGFERDGRRLTAVRTADGRTITAKWFVDASGGAASLLAREFQLKSVQYGPVKVAIWNHFNISHAQEGTTLYAHATPGNYMEWLWEIPINPNTSSIGYVTTGAAVKEKRQQSLSVNDIYRAEVMQYDRLRAITQDNDWRPPKVTSFSCRTFRDVCGPNWVIVGEAASIPDPITGNGVTAALRHAEEASRLITRFRNRGRISWWSRTTYNLRVLQMGKFFNSLIEKFAYDWPIRDRIGLLTAGDIYTAVAWSINHLYSRLHPTGMLLTALWSCFLAAFRSVSWLFYRGLRWFAEPSSSANPAFSPSAA
jgi:2-polyprenyl-6-methoxyphenol hydroxylase-like FAD-dependent oxidoreductase